MPNALIAFGILVLLGVVAALVLRKGGSKEERRRAKAIADANGRRHDRLPEDEQQLADAWHEDVQEARTGDLPKYVEPRRPTVRDIARKYRRPAKHSAKRLPKTRSSNPLTGPLPAELERPVMVPANQPKLVDIGGFTESWTRREIADILARGKAGVSR
jgi:hypothetical protein